MKLRHAITNVSHKNNHQNEGVNDRATVPALGMTVDSWKADQALDMEYWMTELPAQLKDVPLIYLAIPVMTPCLTASLGTVNLAPDAPTVLRRLWPLFRDTTLRWTKTQAVDVMFQLEIGIRYFDLRIATKSNTDKFYFTHGLYAEEITKPLNLIKEFLDSHPDEVVILDCQHFYMFEASEHRRLIAGLLSMFGSRLCPRRLDLDTITLASMQRLRQQVIIVYRHQSVLSTGQFWRPEQLPTPWPRQVSVRELLTFIMQQRRNLGAGFVHQAVLTPTSTFILLRLASNLRSSCAEPVQDRVLPHILELSPGRPSVSQYNTVNVVISDFVEMNRGRFPQTIVQMNFKLLSNSTKY